MIHTGIGGSSGIAIGKVFLYRRHEPEIKPVVVKNVSTELNKFAKAVETSRKQLSAIRDKVLSEQGQDKADIFSSHLMMLEDETLLADIRQMISSSGLCAEYCAAQVIENWRQFFLDMEDEYMRARSSDISDIGRRLVRNVLGADSNQLDSLDEQRIVIAHDLTPSDTALMSKQYVLGFAVNIGSRTSHAAIMARGLEIPAVLGLGDITDKVQPGETIILDGDQGLVITSPTSQQLLHYGQRRLEQKEFQSKLAQIVFLPGVTTDGRQVEIAANIGTTRDLDKVLEVNADGVGLFRTEFLYMDRERLPDEEEQYLAYREVAERLAGRPVIIRTLDIGGDKKLDYLTIPDELNPFLGWRAIRICLERQDIFRIQLRAILRASAYGNIKIMYPMIASIDEVRRANIILEAVKAELSAEGVAYNHNLQTGIMVEIPSAALTADIIATEVDFFSIGTNDLCQYTMAADRMNYKVSAIAQNFHPGLLRLIKQVIDAGHRAGKSVGMCGEMAGDPLATIILLGLGLDEFSMSASSVLQIKQIIRSISYQQAENLASQAMLLTSHDEIRAFSKAALEDILIKL